jgi:CheY-like chemotaxis protein
MEDEFFRALSNAPPQCQVMQSTAPPAPSPATANAPLRILVAEDSADNRLLVKAYLKGSPHGCTFVEDGKSAVEYFAGGGFDLILMDIQMPVMDGLAAAREIRRVEQARGYGRIPILALTAHASHRDIEKARMAGCDLHLSKPISRQRLLDALAQFGGKPPDGAIRIEIPEGIEELVPGYVAEKRAEVGEYKALLAARNFVRIAAMAHNMKGTGASFGMPDLTRIGREMESAALRSDRGALIDGLAELADYLDRVRLPEC